MVYSLTEDGPYTAAIPTGKAVDTYTVWYKAQGDSNHSDSEAQSITASIVKNTVTKPTVQLTPPSLPRIEEIAKVAASGALRGTERSRSLRLLSKTTLAL